MATWFKNIKIYQIKDYIFFNQTLFVYKYFQLPICYIEYLRNSLNIFKFV